MKRSKTLRKSLNLHDYANKDVIQKILLHFHKWTLKNVYTLLACRQVCRRWKFVVDKFYDLPHFVQEACHCSNSLKQFHGLFRKSPNFRFIFFRRLFPIPQGLSITSFANEKCTKLLARRKETLFVYPNKLVAQQFVPKKKLYEQWKLVDKKIQKIIRKCLKSLFF